MCDDKERRRYKIIMMKLIILTWIVVDFNQRKIARISVAMVDKI